MATGRIGTTPVLTTRWSKAPAAGTTSLSGLDDNSVSLVYSVGYEAVYQNGVLLSRGNDYTATNGTTITLTTATVAGDIIEVFANQTIPLTDTYSQTVSDGRFIKNTLTTTTGDIIYASAANTPARLGIGSTDQVLTVSGGIPAWATPSGMTLLSTTSLSGASVTVSSISTSYNDLKLVFEDVYSATDGAFMQVQFNADTANKYGYWYWNTQDVNFRQANTTNKVEVSKIRNSASLKTDGYMLISNYNNLDTVAGQMSFSYSLVHSQGGFFQYNNAAAITSVKVQMDTGNISGGTLKIYGVK